MNERLTHTPATRLRIAGAHIIDPKNRREEHADLFIADGLLAGIGQTPAGFSAEQTLAAQGLVACPGLVDLAAHLGNLESELGAAVAGGITTVACPPDTNPPLDEPGLVERHVRRSAAFGLAHSLPIGALTRQLGGEKLAEMHALRRAGCIAFSQAKNAIADTHILLRAMQYAATFDYPIHLQPQDYYLARDGVAHDGEVAARLGLASIPVCAETIAISTALHLARETGARLHLTRLSSAAGVALVRAARDSGLPVSCDVDIHHLHLADEDIGYFDRAARFNPPLRAATDRAALRTAASEGLAAICSDHTPVAEDGKLLPFAEAQPGATGLELLLPLTLKWATETGVPLCDALARITCDPARILGIAGGTLDIGQPADICLFDPEARWQPTPDTLRSRGKNTPFIGQEMSGQVRITLIDGRVVFGD